ncbi:MFS transporter [Paraburkholderia dipogonis]|uniref:MFS transporter n=1 Tax=Paraburkholderia dipogonis TaxID=1211383 RepID=UPI0038CFD54B
MSEDLRRARLAAMAVLFCNGVLYSTWGVYIPTIKQKFALSDGLLAIAMVAVAAGGIATLARAGNWISKNGSGRASVQSGMLMAVSAAVIPLIPSYAVLLPFLFIYGIATAANDVAANSQGAYIEPGRGDRSSAPCMGVSVLVASSGLRLRASGLEPCACRYSTSRSSRRPRAQRCWRRRGS